MAAPFETDWEPDTASADLLPACDVIPILEHAGERYRRDLGWRTRLVGTTLRLPLTGGVMAMAMPHIIMAGVLPRLAYTGLSAPAILLPGEHGTCVILVDGADFVSIDSTAGTRVKFLPIGANVPLPPSHTPQGSVCWVNAPDPARRCLVSPASVIEATVSTLRFHHAKRHIADGRGAYPPRRPTADR